MVTRLGGIQAPADPPEQCSWDGCDSEDLQDDPMFDPMCGEHMGEAYIEWHADNQQKQAKEN